MPKLKVSKTGKRVGRKSSPNKIIDKVEKKLSRSPEQIRLEAAKRRLDAEKYNEEAGAIYGQKLVVKTNPNFYRHWFNDDAKGSIDRALEMGYYFVQENQMGDFIPTDDLGSRKSKRVGSLDGGGALIAYLMEIPMEYHKQSQQKKETSLRVLEDQIRQGKGGGAGRLEQAYNPSPHLNNINEV